MTKDQIKQKLSKARTHVILRDAFFASIMMDLDPVIDDAVTETSATDGDKLFFNSAYVIDTDVKALAADLRKMSLHVSLSHHLRRGPIRKPARWRKACDIAALCIMRAEGYLLPDVAEAFDVLMNLHQGKTADQIYRELEESEDDDDQAEDDHNQSAAGGNAGAGNGNADQGAGDNQSGDQKASGSQKPGANGSSGQALDGADMRNDAEVSQEQAKNDRRVVNAQRAEKMQGVESGFAKELVEQIKARGVAWHEKLQEFINSKAETRLSWSKPNRRFVGQDIYLPGKSSAGITTLAFIVDTSGSMSNDELAVCTRQIEIAREAIGIKNVVVIQIDTKVKAVHEFDMTEPLPTDMEFVGRGGTNMAPAFAEAMRHDPAVIVMMTDGVFGDLTDNPGVPTIFALTHAGRQGRAPATFGDFVDMPAPEAA